jgi:hypothetical protein
LTSRPVPVTVLVQKLNPIVKIVAKETIELTAGGEERTAARFTMDASGAVTKVNQVQRSILQTFYDPTRNGAGVKPGGIP